MMNVSLRPWSDPRLSLPIIRMFIAVYVVLVVGDADGGRLPVGISDESREMLDTELFSLMP